MTDDRKRKTGGEDRRELQATGMHPVPCARHCEATAFGIEIRELRSALAESRAEVEQVREAYENRTRDWYAQSDAYDQLRARAERLAGALVALTSPICSEEEDAEAHRLARAALNLEPTP